MPPSATCLDLENNNAIEVHVGETKMCAFDHTIKKIGARRIQGSTIVMVVSSQAAIVANIAPARDDEKRFDVMDAVLHARQHMQQVLAYYLHNKSRYFGRNIETVCWIYCAAYYAPDPSPAMKSATATGDLSICLSYQMQGISDELRNAGFDPVFKLYLFTEKARSSESKGTVFVNGGDFSVTIYLDDKPSYIIETPRAILERLKQ